MLGNASRTVDPNTRPVDAAGPFSATDNSAEMQSLDADGPFACDCVEKPLVPVFPFW